MQRVSLHDLTRVTNPKDYQLHDESLGNLGLPPRIVSGHENDQPKGNRNQTGNAHRHGGVAASQGRDGSELPTLR